MDKPDVSAGQVYDCGDEEVLSLGQIVEIIAAALEHPPSGCRCPGHSGCARARWWRSSISRIACSISPRSDTSSAVATWFPRAWRSRAPRAGSPSIRPRPAAPEELALQDPFDYAAEDALVAGWRKALEAMPAVRFAREPGYNASYSGLGGRSRRGPFE